MFYAEPFLGGGLFGLSWPCLSSARREHSRTAATGWTTAAHVSAAQYMSYTHTKKRKHNSRLCREEPWVMGQEALFPSVDKT